MSERRRHRISFKIRGGGIGAKLGVYEDVFLCLSPGEPWLEHRIVEHRYKELFPAAYLEMINRWGHVSQGPRRYSVKAFLTGRPEPGRRRHLEAASRSQSRKRFPKSAMFVADPGHASHDAPRDERDD